MIAIRPLAALLLASSLGVTVPATAQQQSEGYKFLSAVRDAKGNEVLDMLNRPGTTVIDARDVGTGEGALHIVIRRGDLTYLRYLLQKGANPNLRDGKGSTPLLLAVQLGQTEMIGILTAAKANPNLGNASGETPLIRAVQKRDIVSVRALLVADADPDQADVLAGLSARDYAAQDTRTPALAKLFADLPKKKRAAVSGPRL